jgi:DNA-binding transcriptional MocR family regulator
MTPGEPALDDLLAAISDRTPTGIAAALSLLVRTGTWPPGTRLPTVRDVAAALGVSPATVSHAWHGLAGAGVLVTRGRAGSFVRAPDTAWLTPRYRDLAGQHTGFRLDLSTGTPDPELLPELAPVLARMVGNDLTASYTDAPVLPRLERHLRDSWPGPVEAVTVVDGAFDAMSRSLETVVRFGDRVLVEDPCFPPLLDLLEVLGAEPVPVPLDADGPQPGPLQRALGSSPVAFVLQPRAHNPTGVSMSTSRARELARLLRAGAADLVVVEDDHSGDVAAAEDVSLGLHLPGRVLHIHSFSKSHGPDLRIAALGGPAALIDRIVARRMLGPGWTSRMLQRVLVELLTEDYGMTTVAEARRVYHARQQHLVRALAEHGVQVEPGDGVNLWLPVADERAAIVRMAAAGVRVAAGSTFRSGEPDRDGLRGPHVRVTAGQVRGDFAELGAALADGAQAR